MSNDEDVQVRKRRFRMALLMAGIKPIALARRMEVSDAYLAVVITRGAPVLTMQTIAAHLNVSVDWLMTGHPETNCPHCGQALKP